MYRSLVGALVVYCTNWPCERNCGRIHKHLMLQRKKTSPDLLSTVNKKEEGEAKDRNGSIDQGIFSKEQSFDETSPRVQKLEASEKPPAESPAALATPKDQSRNFSFSSNRSLYNRSNSKSHAHSPVGKPTSSDLVSVMTDEDSNEYSRIDLAAKRPISSDSGSDIPKRLLEMHNHGSFEQGIHTLPE